MAYVFPEPLELTGLLLVLATNAPTQVTMAVTVTADGAVVGSASLPVTADSGGPPAPTVEPVVPLARGTYRTVRVDFASSAVQNFDVVSLSLLSPACS